MMIMKIWHLVAGNAIGGIIAGLALWAIHIYYIKDTNNG